MPLELLSVHEDFFWTSIAKYFQTHYLTGGRVHNENDWSNEEYRGEMRCGPGEQWYDESDSLGVSKVQLNINKKVYYAVEFRFESLNWGSVDVSHLEIFYLPRAHGHAVSIYKYDMIGGTGSDAEMIYAIRAHQTAEANLASGNRLKRRRSH
jgi:hypothetical protein